MGKKRLSELLNLEIININNGEKYGFIGDCEMLFDNKTGEIKSIVVTEATSSLFSFKSNDYIELPWSSKFKQSEKTIIFDYKI